MSSYPTKHQPMLAVWIIFVLVAASLTACVTPLPQDPTAAPTLVQPTEPPAAPPTVAPASPLPAASPTTPGRDVSWNRVFERGEMIVGTSADYPPFESMVKYTPQGFDIALMDELGRRMGVPVRFINFAFDGLDNVLQIGPADAVVAALSVTPERLAYADFSDVYYVSQEAILARTDSPIASLESMAEAARYRIAAQKDSSYEAWIRQNLVETGKLPEANLATYMLVSDAVADLKAGRVDLFVLDAPAAQNIVKEGGVKIVGQGLTQQQFAIAVPRGAVALRTKLNEALAAVRADGTLDSLTEQYLKEDAAPLPPLGTEVPVAEATAPACIDNLALVRHLNFDPADLPEFDPGDPITKGWRIRNTGSCTWDEDYTLIYAMGNEVDSAMSGQPYPLQRPVNPGEEVEVEIDLTVPQDAGEYQALWQLTDKTGEAFGELLPVVLRVVVPTPTP